MNRVRGKLHRHGGVRTGRGELHRLHASRNGRVRRGYAEGELPRENVRPVADRYGTWLATTPSAITPIGTLRK